jgi:hypothetical protein
MTAHTPCKDVPPQDPIRPGIPDVVRSPRGGLAQRFGALSLQELQRSHVPQKLCNPPRNELTKKVKVKYCKNPLSIVLLN